MGQQQLLLIVLGVIIVGAAVIVGILITMANERKAQTDLMANEAMGYATLLMQFYHKPKTFGGGGRQFQGFPPPPGKDWQSVIDPVTNLYYSHHCQDYNGRPVYLPNIGKIYHISLPLGDAYAQIKIENWDLGYKFGGFPPRADKVGVRINITVYPKTYVTTITELFEE
jgi:hypothetical protein